MSGPSVRSADTPPLFRELELPEAAAAAVAEHKPILIYFDGDWAEKSQHLLNKVLSQKEASKLIRQRTIAIHLDVVNTPELTKRYHVNDVPLIVLVEADGKEIDRWSGFENATDAQSEIMAALAGETTVVRLRAKVKPDDVKGRFKLGQQLINQGSYEEGLVELKALFDHPLFQAKHRVSQADIINVVLSIHKSCHAASETLLDWRQQLELRVLADPKLSSPASMVMTIDRGIGDEEHLLAFFRQLPAGSRAQSSLLRGVFPLLNKRRAYGEAAALLTPEEAIKKFPPYPGLMIRGMIRMLAPSSAGEFIKRGNRRVLSRRLIYFEPYAGVGDVTAARRIAETIIAEDKSGESVEGLRATAKKACAAEADAFLVKLAIPALKPLPVSP